MADRENTGGVSYVVDNLEFNPTGEPTAEAFVAEPIGDPVRHSPSTKLTDYSTVYVDSGTPL